MPRGGFCMIAAAAPRFQQAFMRLRIAATMRRRHFSDADITGHAIAATAARLPMMAAWRTRYNIYLLAHVYFLRMA